MSSEEKGAMTTMLELADAWLRRWQPSPHNPICKCYVNCECVYCAGTKVMLALRQAAPGGGEVLAEWKQAAGVEAGLRRELTARVDGLTKALDAECEQKYKLIAEILDLKGCVAALSALPQEAPAQPQAARESRPAEFLAWAREMFGPVALLRGERLLRFVEEAIELAQAEGMEREILGVVIDRVYSRRPGMTAKEIGQAQACLETLAENIGLSSAAEAQREWERVQGIPKEVWERRHSEKQKVGIVLSPAKSGVTP